MVTKHAMLVTYCNLSTLSTATGVALYVELCLLGKLYFCICRNIFGLVLSVECFISVDRKEDLKTTL